MDRFNRTKDILFMRYEIYDVHIEARCQRSDLQDESVALSRDVVVNDIRDLNEHLGQKDCVCSRLRRSSLVWTWACLPNCQGRRILLPHPKALEVEGSPLP